MLSAKILLDTLRVKNLLSLAINKLGAFFNQKICIASFLISPLKHTRDVRNELLISIWRLQISS